MSEPGPFVSRLDAKFADLANRYQQHEKYREMRSLAIKLESRLINLEKESSHENKSQFSQKLEADPRLKKRYLESVEKMRNEAHELLTSERSENPPCFDAWAIFGPDGEVVAVVMEEPVWDDMLKDGYTCRKVVITETKGQDDEM